MVGLYFVFYNFGRVHQTLRVTPVILAAIADQTCSIEELSVCSKIALAMPTPTLKTRQDFKRLVAAYCVKEIGCGPASWTSPRIPLPRASPPSVENWRTSMFTRLLTARFHRRKGVQACKPARASERKGLAARRVSR